MNWWAGSGQGGRGEGQGGKVWKCVFAGLVWLQAPSQAVRSLVLSSYQVCAASLTRGPCPSPGCPVVFMLVDRWREGVGVDGKLVEWL